jgi:hypothetical protein
MVSARGFVSRLKRYRILSRDAFITVIKILRTSPTKSIRAISRETGIPRSAVTRIAKGTHRYFERFRLDLLELGDTSDDGVLSLLQYPETDEDIMKRVRYVRCPDCGARVQAQIPCFVCSLRKQNEEKLNFYKENIK